MNEALKKQAADQLGIGAMPQSDQDDILQRTGMLIFQSILVRAMEDLEEADADRLAEFMNEKEPDGEAVMKFLGEKIPNLGEIVEQETRRIKEETATLLKG